MDQPRARRGGGVRDPPGALGVHRRKALPALLAQDADEVDHHRCAAHRVGDRIREAQVRLDRMDLAGKAEGLDIAGKVRPAHRDADAEVLARQHRDDRPAEKPRAAEHGHDLRRQRPGRIGHGKLLPGGRSVPYCASAAV